MGYWIAIAIAICSNVLANIPLKKLSLAGLPEQPLMIVTSAYFWLLAVSGVTLLASYAYAIGGMSLPVGYTLATSGALVVLTIVSPMIFGDTVQPINIAGMVLVIAGIVLMTR